MDKITKFEAGYIMVPNTQYTCSDCVAYDPDDRRCLYLGSEDTILPFDGSNYFVKGEPESIIPRLDTMGHDSDGDSAMGLLTPEMIGFTRSNFGFSCKRCVNFLSDTFDCRKVDSNSPGATLGMIHPDACCNLQQLIGNL